MEYKNLQLTICSYAPLGNGDSPGTMLEDTHGQLGALLPLLSFHRCLGAVQVDLGCGGSTGAARLPPGSTYPPGTRQKADGEVESGFANPSNREGIERLQIASRETQDTKDGQL